jgi:lipid A 3-O-deacylase
MRLRCVFASMVLATGPVLAADWAPRSAFLAEGGVTVHGTYSVTAGVSWALPWQRASRAGQWTAALEGMISYWSARQPGGGRAGFTQLALVPVARYRFDNGRSPWFAEGGIGLSFTNRIYETDRKRFSTRFNFHDDIGVGRSFGANWENEIGVRFTHVSNAGIRHPNPGENFIQLRYSRNF